MINIIKKIFRISEFKNFINNVLVNHNNKNKKIKVSLSCKIYKSSFESNINILGDTEIISCEVGKGTYIGDGGRFTNTRIGRFCSIAKNVQVVIGNHPTRDFISTHPMFYLNGNQVIQEMGLESVPSTIYKEVTYAQGSQYFVNIGNDVWIGQNVLIMNGITIGDGAVIASGAVVTRNVEPYSIVAGVPAKEIRKRFEDCIINEIVVAEWWDKDISFIKNNAEYFQNYDKFKQLISRE
ncbi:CatB-related O-acetyltransferase [Xenorhabdus ehlersii]|uniref:Capsular polysaccharide biosynthesis protein Cap5H n=1 Tax=Xenorhabdus ehlersii TaxID=290111 RepID=A0A2D0IK11_9GAMM|nr:CatB-related O-acetyltransferase [Xenorhabdus ehlersii]PHM22106.1 capsular polysaccharide biosynthesis protein Cap5H [Xenorhabdus ehlersii]RKE93323.1 transferase family hexapeptide repeat protein [Xenorhabdus ehlersii]